MGDFHQRPLLKKGVQLNPEDSAIDAVTQIARSLVHSIQGNEAGIIQDVDTEFLHQYRVSIRKLRSLLALIKGVYPIEDSQRLRSAFGRYATDTNHLRDLDVYLLDEAVHRARLDSSLADGLDAFFDDLRQERDREFGRLKELFLSKDYQEQRKADQDWFFLPDLPRGPVAETRIYKLATEQINRRYNSVCKKGKFIGAEAPDRQVHKLRIECKKLRYLLELFSSLFPAEETNPIIRRLKGLQTTLGNYNDLCIQRQFLLSRLETTPTLPSRAAAAIGGLVISLSQSKKDRRAKIEKRLATFSDPKTKRSLKRLLAQKMKKNS